MNEYNVASIYPSANLDDCITLAGALRKYWNEISNKWHAERTITGNIADYERRILQKSEPLKALSEYTDEDFTAIINELSEVGNYDEGTVEHYQHLIRLIIKCSSEGGETLNKSLFVKERNKTGKIKRNIVKSFSLEEEKRIENWINGLNGKNISGTTLAFVIMFLYGCRNQECAGLTYSSLDTYTNHLHPMLRIYQTTVTKSRETKLKGKTHNAQREIPCLNPKCLELIHSKMDQIKSDIRKDGLNIENVEIPICGSDKNPLEHCTTDEITVRAKEIFNELNIKGNTWDELLTDEQMENINEIESDAQSPQCYALRRNAITRFYGDPICLTEEELHYIAGHAIDVTNIERSDFTNYDVMKELINKMQKHELYKGGKDDGK